HGQEGDVGHDVAVAQAVVELDAVEDAGAVVEAEDVLRLEVPVAVAHGAEGDPVVEERRPSGQVAPDQVLDPAADIGVEHRAGERPEFAEAGLPDGADRVAPAGGGDLVRGRRGGVDGGDAPGDVAQDVVEGPAVPDELGQAPVG